MPSWTQPWEPKASKGSRSGGGGLDSSLDRLRRKEKLAMEVCIYLLLCVYCFTSTKVLAYHSIKVQILGA